MKLCSARGGAISSFPHLGLFTPNRTHLRWKIALPLNRTSIHGTNSGLQYYTNSSLKSSTSEETSSGPSQSVKEETDGVMTLEDVEKKKQHKTEGAEEDSLVNDQLQSFELLDKLNIELDSQGTYSVLLLGSGSLAALWFTNAVVGAIDSIPLFPELMEVVGLACSLWFSIRFLLFKKNRDELAAKVEDIKKQVLGLNDD